ncbi:MAG TPA: tetratricopeptide repeat protein [Nodularia sp. (in: cyanobacteria)]|nr:tetratricopeptide repeat protein [Nodularia sp. (in: cyanobacteria)]
MHEDLQRGNYVAISGMGGVGKTELATQYAKRYQESYGGIAWFNDRNSNLAAEILEFFIKLGLEIPQELGGKLLSLKEQVAWCWSRYPDSTSPILIVFDDVTDLANLRQVLPEDQRFCVLVTTTPRILDPNFIQEISLDVLSPEKALELLKRLLGNTDRRVDNQLEAATAICECLGYLPLGIELVGGYLVRDPGLSLNTMFERLKTQKLAEISLQREPDSTIGQAQLGVKAAFTLTWEKLDPLTQQLGKFLSLFAPQQILWDLVNWVATDGGKAEDEAATQLTWSQEEINSAKKQLYARNLLQLVEATEGEYYKIHALVRWFLQEQLTNSGEIKSVLETTFASAMISVAHYLPQSPTSEDIESVKDVVPHIEDLGNRIIADIQPAGEAQINSPASVPNDQVIWIFVGVSRFYAGQGLYKLAEPWHEQCVNVCQALFAGDHPDVATSLNNLGELYRSQGRYSQAEPLFIQALEMKERLFVGDHSNVATSLNNLAFLYKSQGRYSQAEPLFIQALEMTQRLFAGDHPNVATSLNNLGELYRSQGRYSQVEPLLIQALEMTQRLFVGDHANVATSWNNLALLYRGQGKYSEAEPLFIQALEMTQRLFAGDHSDVATSLNNLAELYRSQGRYSQAEPLYKKALEMRQRLFAGDHLDVATSWNNLALLYRGQGKYSEAEPLFIQALEMTQRLFADDHPNVATSLNNLAGLYDSQGRYSEAEPLYKKALEMCQRVLGVNHPTTATIKENLAILRQR